MKLRTVQRGVGIAIVIAGALSASAAYAAWSSRGSGAATGMTGTVSITLVAAGSPSTPLVPGGTADVTLKVNNPNPFAVKLVSVAGSGAVSADAGHSSCAPTGVTFNGPVTTNITLGPTSTNNAVDLAAAASMSALSANGCQGATFSIPVTITVQAS